MHRNHSGQDRADFIPALILTVGHSARPLEEFLRLLQAHRVTLIADVRKMPRSRRNPQLNRDTLPASLRDAGIGYVDLPGLGGLRRRKPDSPNSGWKNASFQGYADYMLTPEFEKSLQELIERARGERVALMCAEAVLWRCHRSLIADALDVRGISVEHILSEKRTQRHVLKPWARVEGTQITYPPTDEQRGRDVHETRSVGVAAHARAARGPCGIHPPSTRLLSARLGCSGTSSW
jgi:hypothetical protein